MAMLRRVPEDHLSYPGTRCGMMARRTAAPHIRGTPQTLRRGRRFHLSSPVTWPRKMSRYLMARICAAHIQMRNTFDPHLNEKGINANRMSVISGLFFWSLALVERRAKLVARGHLHCHREQNGDL